MLPQFGHSTIFCAASVSAAASGSSRSARFLSSVSAALRAERCPSPGSRASSPISRSISVPAVFLLMMLRTVPSPHLRGERVRGEGQRLCSDVRRLRLPLTPDPLPARDGERAPGDSEQLEARRQSQAAGDLLHLGLRGGLGLALGVLEGGDDQVLQDLGFLRLDQARVDLQAPRLQLAVELDLDEPAARLGPSTSRAARSSCICCMRPWISWACFIIFFRSMVGSKCVSGES